ncbi:DJ-1/PfpI family protein [Streptosporangium brasiliense]|uniref:Transcriptional regulator GlxA family with amidase domain n=1 Tax=Streptosporangium brasiliense TaxID=47480 RepID=A0ABT9RGJ8_9ACTN|nr:DJ-1/PfpI family protein [Streptosporangium brasiliense]MDP9868404.1 transcriptional regulator GlxA family with amidase domain [Streptosporangium brasiliense]
MEERLFVIVAYAGAELLDIACVSDALDVANRLGAGPPYLIRMASPGGRDVACGSGLVLRGQQALERLSGPLDTLLVAGGQGYEAAAADVRLVGHVRRLARESRRVASVCTGAGVLAATGLLDGRRATTHWAYAGAIAGRYPRVRVDPAPIYIRDGRFCTAAGVTSALDLTLALIEDDHGAELARRAARGLVTYLQRPGDQRQMSMFVAAPPPDHDLVRALVGYVGAHLDADLSAAALARRAGVSGRHLAGCSPAGWGRARRGTCAARAPRRRRSCWPRPRCGGGGGAPVRVRLGRDAAAGFHRPLRRAAGPLPSGRRRGPLSSAAAGPPCGRCRKRVPLIGMRWEALPARRAVGGPARIERTAVTRVHGGLTCYEVQARGALERTAEGWALSPYRGCAQACRLLRGPARPPLLGLDTGTGFDSRIVVRTNIVRRLRAELASAWDGEHVRVGMAGDCYQGAEEIYRLMPGVVAALREAGAPFTVHTKSTLILRDAGLLAAAPGRVWWSRSPSSTIRSAAPWSPARRARRNVWSWWRSSTSVVCRAGW